MLPEEEVWIEEDYSVITVGNSKECTWIEGVGSTLGQVDMLHVWIEHGGSYPSRFDIESGTMLHLTNRLDMDSSSCTVSLIESVGSCTVIVKRMLQGKGPKDISLTNTKILVPMLHMRTTIVSTTISSPISNCSMRAPSLRSYVPTM